jgi:hypothetical protein
MALNGWNTPELLFMPLYQDAFCGYLFKLRTKVKTEPIFSLDHILYSEVFLGVLINPLIMKAFMKNNFSFLIKFPHLITDK